MTKVIVSVWGFAIKYLPLRCAQCDSTFLITNSNSHVIPGGVEVSDTCLITDNLIKFTMPTN